MPFSIQAELAKLETGNKMTTEVNLVYLRQTARDLGYENFEVRDDSKLAYEWASYRLTESAEDVAHEMAFIQFLHAETGYGDETQTSLRRLADEIKRGKGRRLSWSEVWRTVRTYGPDLIKFNVIARRGGVPQLATLPTTYRGAPTAAASQQAVDAELTV